MRGDTSYEALVVRTGSAAGAAETAVIRLIAGLPPGWTCTERVGEGWIRMWIRTGEGVESGAAARAWLVRTLGDRALAGWGEGVLEGRGEGGPADP